MILKFKNKHLMAIDKMIKDANDAGGMIDSIILDPKEALGLMIELGELGTKYLTNITMIDHDGEDVIRKKLLWGESDLAERCKDIVQRWYKTEYAVMYRTVKLVVVKPVARKRTSEEGWLHSDTSSKLDVPKPPSVDDIPERPAPPAKPPVKHPAEGAIAISLPQSEPPKMPPGRIISEGCIGVCDECGSSLKYKWFFWKAGGCIQPECENYWKNPKR